MFSFDLEADDGAYNKYLKSWYDFISTANTYTFSFRVNIEDVFRILTLFNPQEGTPKNKPAGSGFWTRNTSRSNSRSSSHTITSFAKPNSWKMTTTDINQQIQAFNKDVAGWGKRVRNQTISNARRLKHPVSKKNTHDHESLGDSIGQKTYKSDGEIDCIGFSFARHGVFWQKGVGRGYVMQNGIRYTWPEKENRD